jgi:type I restriction enzyme S subunit
VSDFWPKVRLEDLVSKVGSGSTPKGGETSYQAAGIPFIRSKNVVFFGFKRNGLAYLDDDQAAVLKNAEVCAGDVLLNITGASIGRVTRAPVDMDGARVNQHVCIIRPEESLEPRFLNAFLSSPNMQDKIWADNYGVTRQALTKQQILDFDIPLPPLDEQKRIADKLDAVLARVVACRNRLDLIPVILKRFRQSVLAAATSGKLTEKWRYEDTSSWTHERADDVCGKVQSGGTPKEGFTHKGIPFLKVYNIVDQKVAFDYKPQFITPAIHDGSMSKSKVQPGDVLMNIVGPPLGKVAIVPDTNPAWNINQAITLFRPSDRISTGWLYCILCGGENIADIIHETRGSAGQTNISLSQCRDFIFPVPPVEEQTEIVCRVESLFAFADRLEARYISARAQVEKLTPATLAKAFSGELVPQDPNDEPASVLLERIKEQHGNQPASKPKKSRKIAA